MKRYLAVFLSVLLLLPMMVLPAMADTSYELVFYPDGSISTYMVISGESYIAVTDFMIPDGYYNVSFRYEFSDYSASYDAELLYVYSGSSLEPLYFEQIPSDNFDYAGQSSFFDCLFALDSVVLEGNFLPLDEFHDMDNISVNVQIESLSDAPDTFCYYLFFDGAEVEWGNPVTSIFLTLEPVLTSSPVELSNLVSADMLNNVMFQILALLPVALVTVVGFIGIRKGITFVRRLLGSA